MRGYTFKETIGDIDFSFEKLDLNNDEVMFFVSCNKQNERSFFMSKNKSGNWSVLYHNVLSKEVLRLEHQLSDTLKEKGY